MKTRNLILFLYLIFFFSSSIKCLEENKEITNLEDLITLVDSKEFQDYLEQQEDDDINLKSIFSGDGCLVPKKEAQNLLKNQYGNPDITVDKNVQFILGKCYPVLLIPGIYATKLVVEVNCKSIAQYEKTTTLKEIRIFCGDTVCPDLSAEKEEHPLFVGLLDSAFTILNSDKSKYSSCLGYFMTYFQNENECPTVNSKKLCKYSPYIKVGFYGSSSKTQTKGRCGVEGVIDILQSENSVIDKIINIGAAKSFETVSKALLDKGYIEGFSFGGLPNDYRRYLATNNFATKVFRSQIERLYENTGKPVVIVAHSYGTLLTLTNLVKTENKDLLSKIKKFVAVAPPFAGSSKLLDVFLHGMNDWNKSFDIFGKTITISNYNIFGQNLMYKVLPVLTELRPLPIAAKLFTDSKYKEFGDAIKERISFENRCKELNCPDTTPKFDKIFKGYFPSFSDSECAYESIKDNSNSFSRKCFTNIYNVGECPSVLTTTSVNSNPYGNNIEQYCGQKSSSFYYQGECNSNNENCVDNIYSTKGPYVYDNTEAVDYLIDRYNKDYAKSIDGVKITKSYFETKDFVRQGCKKSIEYNNNISIIKDLPPPPVDTDLIYASFAHTAAAFILYDKDFTKEGKIFNKGGDATVPTWSSLLTGLKWIYEKKTNNLSPKFKLVEYCSRLGKSGKYAFNPNIEQSFIALGCSCLNKNNQYDSSYGDCEHASMINDDTFIDYLLSVVDDPKIDITYSAAKKKAILNYNGNSNHESLCNYDLKRIFDTAK